MRFPEFVELDQYDIQNKKDIEKIFEQFLLSTQLISFTQAILRHKVKAKKIKVVFKSQLKDYINAFNSLPMNQFINSIADSNLQGDQKLDQKQIKFLTKTITKTMSPTMIREPILVEISYRIEHIIKTEGKKILEEEQKISAKMAAEVLRKEGRLIDFPKYTSIAFNHSEMKSTTTVNQFVGYMNFIRDIINPVREFKQYTENRKKAQEIYELISKIDDKIKKNDQSIQEINQDIEILDIELYWSEYLAFHRISEMDPPPGHSAHGCLATASSEGELNLQKHLACKSILDAKLEEKEKFIREKLCEFSDHKGGLNENQADILKFFNALEYWKNNFAGIYRRRIDIERLSDFKADPKKKGVTIYRNAKDGERKELVESKQFMQFSNSLEKEKNGFI